MRLAGKVAAITGGTAGIGRGVAEAFVREGAAVVVNGRRTDLGERMMQALGPDHCFYLPGDVTERGAVDRLVEAAAERYGRLDVMVNNAGGSAAPTPIAQTSDEAWEQVIRWNLHTAFWGTRAAIRIMAPRRAGRIINVSSVEGKHGKPVLASYVAAKHAVNGLTKSAAREVGPLGITVNALCPGLVLTDGVRRAGPRAAAAMGITFDEFVSLFTQEAALDRPVTVEEVAAVAVMLASEDGSGITGALLSVDGGTAAY